MKETKPNGHIICVDFGGAPPFNPLDIPEELRNLPHWVGSKFSDDSRKLPVDAKTGKLAKVNGRDTWSSFNKAQLVWCGGARFDGLGFVFSSGQYVGIDLDDCRDARTGAIEQWAQAIIEELDSYTEISQSGTGVHIIVIGCMTEGRHRCGQVEIYNDKRYFVMTGNVLPGRELIFSRDLRDFERRMANGMLQQETDQSESGENRKREKDTSASGVQWKLICSYCERHQSRDANVLEAGFRAKHRRETAARDAEKGDRVGKTNTRYDIENWIKKNPEKKTESGLLTRTLERVVQNEVRWLWKQKIPYGYPTVLAGYEGVGKSTIICYIIAKVTKGYEVLLITDEDSEDDALVPRLNVAGADLSKTHHMQEVAWKDDKNGYAFEILRDSGKLETWLMQHPAVKVVVIDPWLSYIGNRNEYSSREVRQVLMPLQNLARKLRLVILCVAHFKKGDTGRANDKISGALAIVQVPRSVLLVAKVREENGVLYGEMHQTKHNLNPQSKGVQYQIVGAVSKRNGKSVSTCKATFGNESQKDAEAIFAANDPKERSIDLCCGWMIEYLSDGELPASEVIKAGKQKGFTERTIFRARNDVANSRKNTEQNNRAYWSLP